MLSLSSELLLLLSDQSLTFTSIRETTEVFGYKNRKVIWSTLERLAKKNYLKKAKSTEGIRFSLTNQGQKELPALPTFIPTPDKAWNGKWIMVLFDIPEEKRRARDAFSISLREMGFGRMQNSVYVSVHNMIDRVKSLAKSLDISEQIKVILIEDIGISDQRKFAREAWHLDELNRKYKNFVAKNKNGYKGAHFTSDILRYWLKKTKYEYYNLLHEDPVLPKELLPGNWMGYEAQKVWNEMEAVLATY